jgi:hypothetical protein
MAVAPPVAAWRSATVRRVVTVMGMGMGMGFGAGSRLHAARPRQNAFRRSGSAASSGILTGIKTGVNVPMKFDYNT